MDKYVNAVQYERTVCGVRVYLISLVLCLCFDFPIRLCVCVCVCCSSGHSFPETCSVPWTRQTLRLPSPGRYVGAYEYTVLCSVFCSLSAYHFHVLGKFYTDDILCRAANQGHRPTIKTFDGAFFARLHATPTLTEILRMLECGIMIHRHHHRRRCSDSCV